MKPALRPCIPACSRCGIDGELRFTRAHGRCDRARYRTERAEQRTRERRARAYLKAHRVF